MNVRKLLEKSRDTVCIPQQGDTCHGYGGILCDASCPKFPAGIERRENAHINYLNRKAREEYIIFERGVRRISHSPDHAEIIIERGEYVNDGQEIPVFTCFEQYILPSYLLEDILPT